MKIERVHCIQVPGSTSEPPRGRLDQELGQDVLAAGANGLRVPISLVRSVTETSMVSRWPDAVRQA
jgi:hypothetical protein